MRARPERFNTYFVLALLVLHTAGCRTADPGRDKARSTIRLHLEVSPDGTDRNAPAPIFREHPVMINVEKTPFLDESSVAEAKIVEAVGGFAIQIQFDRRG